MDILFKSRHTTVPERFRRHAAAKLAKLERLDSKAVRVDVEVSKERNPRQADHSERVELTIRSRGPAVRAEAAADDRYAALDLAFAKLEGQLRRAAERRKARRDTTVRSPGVLAGVGAAAASRNGTAAAAASPHAMAPEAADLPGARVNVPAGRGEELISLPEEDTTLAGLVPIQMEGDGPLVVREKVHVSHPMTIDQALLEMELVGHDFFLFHDCDCDKFSVVYRRRGYDYGVIRLVEE
jgi:ribosomal subunit interface protein